MHKAFSAYVHAQAAYAHACRLNTCAPLAACGHVHSDKQLRSACWVAVAACQPLPAAVSVSLLVSVTASRKRAIGPKTAWAGAHQHSRLGHQPTLTVLHHQAALGGTASGHANSCQQLCTVHAASVLTSSSNLCMMLSKHSMVPPNPLYPACKTHCLLDHYLATQRCLTIMHATGVNRPREQVHCSLPGHHQ